MQEFFENKITYTVIFFPNQTEVEKPQREPEVKWNFLSWDRAKMLHQNFYNSEKEL